MKTRDVARTSHTYLLGSNINGPYPPPDSFPPHGDASLPYAPPAYPAEAPSSYPGMLPPPVPYPSPRRWRLVVAALAAVALVAAVVVAIVFAAHRNEGGVVTKESARTAIQGYLDALSKGDDETIARHNLCGLYDAVKERKSDLALAGLASDAFRNQFSRAEVTSIDKVVPWSANQAQVLFTMRVAPASRRGQQPTNEEQGIAQLLVQGRDVLVCSYLMRSGQY